MKAQAVFMESCFSGVPVQTQRIAKELQAKSWDFTVEDAKHFLINALADSMYLSRRGVITDRARSWRTGTCFGTGLASRQRLQKVWKLKWESKTICNDDRVHDGPRG